MAQIFRTPESIAPLVAAQFPEFYREEGEGFIAFLKAYYEWLDSQYPTDLMTNRDIDRTPDDFIIHFKETYLKNIQFDVATNKRLLVKNSLDLYRAKGTERAVGLFMKLVYGKAAAVYYPGDDIFRASDADYVEPKYIEVSATSRNIDLVGRQISGTTSGTTAFVEKYIKRKTNVDYIHILYISNATGKFTPGELLITDGNVRSNSPVVIGSVAAGEVTEGGSGFAVGDICEFVSDRGRSGLCRITEIGEISGIVDFELLYGGYGFSTNATTIVSETVLTANGLTTSNTDYFPTFADASQQIVQLTYNTANGTIAVGNSVDLKSNNTTVVASGTIVRADIDASDTGIIYVYTTANGAAVPTITQIANSFTANVSASVDLKATATVMGHSNTYQLAISNTAEVLTVGTTLTQYWPNNVVIGSGTVTKVYTPTTVDVQFASGKLVSGQPFYMGANVNSGYVDDIQGKFGIYNTTNLFYADAPVRVANGTTIGTVAKKSAGENASFDIGSIVNEEIVFRNTDFLAANTAARLDSGSNPIANQTMMSVPLNSYAYGFAKNPQANSADTIYSTLNYQSLSIGTIASLSNINPGEKYDENPMVLIYEPAIGAARHYDFLISYTNATGNFFQGENVYQTANTNTRWDVTVVDGTSFNAGDVVSSKPTANTVGTVLQKSGNIITVTNVTGPGFIVGTGLYNGTVNVAITAAQAAADVVTAYGKIRSTDSGVLQVARLRFNGEFTSGLKLVGESSGVTADISSISPDQNNAPVGYNAIINANTVTSDSLAKSIEIVDSGIGYTKNEDVTFFKVGEPEVVGTFRVTHNGIGYGQGYFRSTRGFASSNKYLFDGDYYQEYSYEVISSIPFDKYKDVLDKVLHVAGTKAFGSVLLENDASYNFAHSETEVNVAFPRLQNLTPPTVSGTNIDSNVLTVSGDTWQGEGF